jgi:hypothetical protein
MRPSHHHNFIAALAIALVAFAGCSAGRTTCDDSDAACTCETDEDCTYTPYHSPVASEGDCYDVWSCCSVDGVPRNADYAANNKQEWKDQGCTNDFDGATCGECNAGDLAWVECIDQRCVKFYSEYTSRQYDN